MIEKIICASPNIPQVLEMTKIVARTYPLGSKFMLECPKDRTVLILEGHAQVWENENFLELSAGQIVQFPGGENVKYDIKVLQKFVIAVK